MNRRPMAIWKLAHLRGRRSPSQPERVQEALGELAGAAKDGLLALSVGVGLGVLAELMTEEVDEVVGPKGKHNADRSAVRHGHESGEVTLGGRRVLVERPRVRAADGSGEVPLAICAHFEKPSGPHRYGGHDVQGPCAVPRCCLGVAWAARDGEGTGSCRGRR